MAMTFTKTEAKVLIEVAQGSRSFSMSRELRALHKLVAKGLIEARFDSHAADRCKKWNFGREWKYVRVTTVEAVVTSTVKIERAIAKRGKAVFVSAVNKAVA